MTPRHVPGAVPQGDEALEAAHRHRDHLGACIVLAQPARQHVQRQVVAAEDDEQAALTLVRQHHEVHRVGARGGAVELLHVALGRPGLDELDQSGLLEAEDVVPHPGRMVVDGGAELGERGRPAHQQAEETQTLVVGEHADGVDSSDVADLFHGRVLSPTTAGNDTKAGFRVS